MFVTAMISNTLILEAMSSIGIEITWLKWFKFAVFPGLIILLILPFILKFTCNLKINNLGDIQLHAAKNYTNLGKLTGEEKIIISMFMVMLLMWIFSDCINISVTETTLLGVCIFIFLGIIDVKDMLSAHTTFTPMFMMAILISYVNCLVSLGAIEWFTKTVSVSISGFSPEISLIFLSIVYFFAHCFFSGETSQIIALYTPFLLIGSSFEMDKLSIAMTLAVFSTMSDVLTNYNCPGALTIFSAGYITSKKWFYCGIIVALISMTVWFSYIFFLR
jgi:DASS family divalent anion:Na+ symporter